MKTFLIFALMLSASLSRANVVKASNAPEFCVYDSASTDDNQNFDPDTLFQIQDINVLDAQDLHPFFLALVNDYLVREQMVTQQVTLADVKALFADGGDQEDNELHIVIRTSLKTARTHIEVMSYPGDNPVGDIYNLSGVWIGNNSDDSYSFKSSTGVTGCYNYSK